MGKQRKTKQRTKGTQSTTKAVKTAGKVTSRKQEACQSPKRSKGQGKPSSVSAQILVIVKDAEKLLGIPTLMKELASRHGRQTTPAFRKVVKRALDKLVSEKRADFSKHGESYFAGKDSVVGIKLRELREKEAVAEANRKEANEGKLRCPWCSALINTTDLTFSVDVFEAFDARGAGYTCVPGQQGCGKTFYTSYLYDPWVTLKKYEPYPRD
eukprot:m.1638173 g.1638173  ORF g.1638173 m.1638173 type:complete len:212 (-) comp27117_c0_seq1:161-796(-)